MGDRLVGCRKHNCGWPIGIGIRMHGGCRDRRDHGDKRPCGSAGEYANPQRGFDTRIASFSSIHHLPILLNL